MRIISVHDYYQIGGGEDRVFELEASLLQSAGHEVRRVVLSNAELHSLPDRVAALASASVSRRGIGMVRKAVKEFRPDVVHVHNYFPLFSPAIFEACSEAGVPTVHTLHNYRSVCSSAVLARRGRVCEVCVNGNALWGAIYRCYRGSLIASLATARMIHAPSA